MTAQNKLFKVLFYPEKIEVQVKKGETIYDAIISAGININAVCGGEGICGKCKVIVVEGNYQTDPTLHLRSEEIKKGYILACQTKVLSDITVEIPEDLRVEEGEIPALKDYVRFDLKKERVFSHSPLSTKIFLKLTPPTLSDNISDLDRLYREIKRKFDIPIMQTGLYNLRRISKILRECNYEVTVLLGKREGTVEIVSIEPGDTTDKNWGVALDLGTTTVVAQLVNLVRGEVIDTHATYNSQAKFGADVISRCVYAEKGGLEELQEVVVKDINELINTLALENNVRLNDITAIMGAGNTIMTHLLLGVNPGFIRREPYIPAFTSVPVGRAAEVGIKIYPRGWLGLIPCVASYVGGDITAGVLTSGLDEQDEISLLIDMGTNGEIVLGCQEFLVCCACSVGPAFEGGGIKYGMRAAPSAIYKIEINDNLDVHYEVIKDKKPKGICGSAIIDLLSSMFDQGVIGKDGKLNKERDKQRIRAGVDGWEFVVAYAGETEINQDIVITQNDIDNLIRSKAAVFAATKVLIEKVGYKFSDIKKIFIAGAFGNYLNIKDAIKIGLLPDLPEETFEYIGNGSLQGASRCLLSHQVRERAHRIAEKMTYIELSVDNTFYNEFIASMFLPHTDLSLFPTIMGEKRW